MDEQTYRLREFRRSDYPEKARLIAQIEPTFAVSPEEMERREVLFFPPPLVLFQLVVEEISSAKAVAFGDVHHDPESYDEHSFWIFVTVDTGHQRRGVGQSLAKALREEATRRGARILWSTSFVDDTRGKTFLDKQGFVERQRAWRSRLVLRDAVNLPDRSSELNRRGVTFTSVAALNLADERVVRELYELSALTSQDEPRLGSFTPVTFEQFVAVDLSGPVFMPEAYLLARADNRFVGMTALRRSSGEPKSLVQSFTGTLREYRGRGIATELKRQVIAYARDHGFESILTGNDSLNEPMLAVNRKFGFKPERTRVFGELTLASTAAS